MIFKAVADLGGRPGPLPATKYFSILRSFRKKINNILSRRPLRVGSPCENPGSATVKELQFIL